MEFQIENAANTWDNYYCPNLMQDIEQLDTLHLRKSLLFQVRVHGFFSLHLVRISETSTLNPIVEIIYVFSFVHRLCQGLDSKLKNLD